MTSPLVSVLNGINLNMFGHRDPAQYGTATLGEIEGRMAALAGELGLRLEFFQTNHEGEMVEKIHQTHLAGEARGVIINAGAWTHYSYGLADALAMLAVPIVEVHMSNVAAREPFRHVSVISPLAKGVITGFGPGSYLLALRALAGLLGGGPGHE